jgi:hypothetical protein
MRPREGQAVSKLLCFLDQEEVLLPAELVCADQSSNVADGALKDAATRHRHEMTHMIELLQITYLTVSVVFDFVKSMPCVKLSASLKKS